MTQASARDRVLGAVRGALRVTGDEAPRREAVRTRLESPPGTLVPAQGQQAGADALTLFIEKLEAQGASVAQVADAAQIPPAVSEFLRQHNLPAQVRTGADAMLAEAPWDETPSLARLEGRGEAGDAVTLSRAIAGAAETGTLFLTSGTDNPTSLNFLPDTHIVAVRREDIVGGYADGWSKLRALYGPRTLPRTVNLISGPSRTADIEQTIVMGAHGPRRLHVIIVGD